jgi:Zn-dependent protease
MLLYQILLFAPPLLIAIILHEVAHGYVAYRLGDPTAKFLGRLSLNPLRHIDPMMTIILPGMLILAGSPVVFGGAKPVPVDPRYFRNPVRGMMWVALAGPVTNFILAAIFYLLLKLSLPLLGALAMISAEYPYLIKSLLPMIFFWLSYGIIINIALGVFNLVPIPPLDGGRIAVALLPRTLARPLARLEPYGLFILFFLLYTGVINDVLEFALKAVFSLICKDLPIPGMCNY